MAGWNIAETTIACLLVPNFPVRVEVLRHPIWDGLPLALTDLAPSGRRKIIDCSPEAAARGVRVGMLAREVVDLCPQAVIVTADPVYYAAAFNELLRALYDVSPTLERGGLGIVYADLRGLARHFASPAVAGQALIEAAPALLRPRMGISNTKFTALAAAHQAEPGALKLVPAARARAFLAECSVELLPVEETMKLRLQRLGLPRLGDVARLPVGALQAQFGPAGRRAWELARGEDRALLAPEPISEPLVERVTLPTPSAQYGTLLIGLHQLVARLLARPELRGRGVRRLQLQLSMEQERSWEQTVVLKGALSDPRRLVAILGERLSRVTLDGPVEEIGLIATEVSVQHAWQEALLGGRRPLQEQLQEAVRELTTRYGAAPLYQAVEVEPWSRIPERRWALLPFDPSTNRAGSR
jgi:DNA polymerase-4/protein ImuB